MPVFEHSTIHNFRYTKAEIAELIVADIKAREPSVVIDPTMVSFQISGGTLDDEDDRYYSGPSLRSTAKVIPVSFNGATVSIKS